MDTAVLLVSCPDKKGIVAAIADFLYTHNANILHADEHQDSEENLFFLRIEWDMSDFSISLNDFPQYFSSIAEKFSMSWNVYNATHKKNIALFASKELHCLADILYRYHVGEFYCNIPVIISNHEDAKEISEFYKIPFLHIASENKVSAEKEIIGVLQEKKVESIILARYMQILSPEFVNQFQQKIINIHHSFLPAFVGAKPYHQAYARGVKLIGATAHFVTANLDQGPIIEQDTLRVSHRDTTADLAQKGKDIEKIVLSRAIKSYLENKILVYKNKTIVF
jgi:formyltetrahydrofolate deformylase